RFFFYDSARTRFYPLSLHDALPISVALPDVGRVVSRAIASRREGGHRGSAISAVRAAPSGRVVADSVNAPTPGGSAGSNAACQRSEEHTSELQSRENLVCRLLLEKK